MKDLFEKKYEKKFKYLDKVLKVVAVEGTRYYRPVSIKNNNKIEFQLAIGGVEQVLSSKFKADYKKFSNYLVSTKWYRKAVAKQRKEDKLKTK